MPMPEAPACGERPPARDVQAFSVRQLAKDDRNQQYDRRSERRHQQHPRRASATNRARDYRRKSNETDHRDVPEKREVLSQPDVFQEACVVPNRVPRGDGEAGVVAERRGEIARQTEQGEADEGSSRGADRAPTCGSVVGGGAVSMTGQGSDRGRSQGCRERCGSQVLCSRPSACTSR